MEGPWSLLTGHVVDMLRTMPEGSVHCVITSPPYWGLRDYGTAVWEGGDDPSCDHRLHADVERSISTSTLTGGLEGTGAVAAQQIRFRERCRRCGALRVEPTVWDGDSTCGHEWSEPLPPRHGHQVPQGDSPMLHRRRTKWRNAESVAVAQNSSSGNVCLKCGAWRGALGLEPTPSMYVKHLADVMDEVRRILRPDGTVWLNLGDSYAANGGWCDNHGLDGASDRGRGNSGRGGTPNRRRVVEGLKPKDLVGVPWLAAFELRARGWWLRAAVVWEKPNCMPESTRDRPTRSYENVFLLAPSERYFYDREAVLEPLKDTSLQRISQASFDLQKGGEKDYARTGVNPNRSARRAVENLRDRVYKHDSHSRFGKRSPNRVWGDPESLDRLLAGRNMRDVWSIPTKPFPEAHFACVDDETECLTQKGWKRRDQLVVGEMIAQFDMELGVATWGPLKAVAYYLVENLEMVAAKSRDVSMVLTPNHRCVIRRRDKMGGLTSPTVVLADDLKPSARIITSAVWEDAGVVPWSNEFLELLGWYVAEGGENQGKTICVYQSVSKNPSKVERIENLLRRTNSEYVRKDRPRSGQSLPQGGRARPDVLATFTVRGHMASFLRALAPSKRLTPACLAWPESSIRSLLTGLIGGDGWTRKDGRMGFSAKGRGTADLIQALAVRLGYTAVLSTNKGQSVVSITSRPSRSLRGTNGVKPIVSRIRYTGYVWCPKTPKGTWVARRRGRVFVTGNTMPEALVEPCVKAGTSSKGCCPECGAPWSRVLERRKHPTRDPEAQRAAAVGQSGREDGKTPGPGGMVDEIQHAGWKPGCAHGLEPVPCTVLDPFAGSGTVGVVALKHGRRFIGIDISPEYVRMAESRLAGVDPLFQSTGGAE